MEKNLKYYEIEIIISGTHDLNLGLTLNLYYKRWEKLA